jgi:dTDP-4-amino-4,6-dideoxygalactose transaminase
LTAVVTKRVPFLDLRVTDPMMKAELLAAVARVLDHGRLVGGVEVEAFEQQIAEATTRKHAVGVGSGSSAVYLALRALDLPKGSEVVTTPLSWLASYQAIVAAGLVPVPVDIQEDLNIDPRAIEAALTPATRAILVVHFTGRMCDMDPILSLAQRHGLPVIEDAAQAFGATYKGRPAGAFGQVAAFSMNAMKVLNSYGEAGAVVTDDAETAKTLGMLRYNGLANRNRAEYVALNHRLDAMQAALLQVSLRHFDKLVERRRRTAAFYDEALTGVVQCPPRSPDNDDVYYTYTIQTDRRDALIDYLTAEGIEVQVQHGFVMCDQPAFQPARRPPLPRARKAIGRIVSLPVHEKLSEPDRALVADRVRSFFR